MQNGLKSVCSRELVSLNLFRTSNLDNKLVVINYEIKQMNLAQIIDFL